MDNFVLYKKLYDIDKNGHKKAVKNMKPLFRYSKLTLDGNKKNEIIRVAQENLYMLKRINETVPMVMDICSHPKQSLSL